MKILVRGTNWVGDAVMQTPALRELRRIFPDASITLHTRSWAEGLFANASFIDDLVTFEKSRWTVKDIYDNSQFLRDDGYDLAMIMPNSFESALTTLVSRIPRRIGYNKDLRGLLLTDPIPVPEWKNRRHEVYYYLNLVGEIERRLLGRETVGHCEPDITVEIAEERKTAARRILEDAGVDTSKKTVILGAGSANSLAKRWPAERFGQLSDLLRSAIDVNVVLIGSKDEADVSEKVIATSAAPPIDLTGKTSLAEAVAMVSVADLVISNDMGLAHLSPAVGTKTIVIFGPTDPRTARPFSDNANVIWKQVECAPCFLRTCPIDHRCMTQISPKEVFEAAKLQLTADEKESVETTGDIR